MATTPVLLRLQETIDQLEIKRAAEGKILKENFLSAYESIKPVNLIRNTLNEITQSGLIKQSLLVSAVSLASGYIFKKVLPNTTNNPVQKLLGTALLGGVTHFVLRNPAAIVWAVKKLVSLFPRKKNTRTQA